MGRRRNVDWWFKIRYTLLASLDRIIKKSNRYLLWFNFQITNEFYSKYLQIHLVSFLLLNSLKPFLSFKHQIIHFLHWNLDEQSFLGLKSDPFVFRQSYKLWSSKLLEKRATFCKYTVNSQLLWVFSVCIGLKKSINYFKISSTKVDVSFFRGFACTLRSAVL